MNGIKNIFSNEHLLIGVLLIIGATVLCAVGVMPLAQWESYSQVVFGVAAGAHAVISVGDSLAQAKAGQNDVISTVADGIGKMIAARESATVEPAKPPTEKV